MHSFTLTALFVSTVTLFLCSLNTIAAPGTPVKIQINTEVTHKVGTFDQFERERYITIHETNNGHDWWGKNPQSLNQENELENLIGEVMDKRDVYFGRDTGSMKWIVINTEEDPNRKGWANSDTLKKLGGDYRWWYNNNPDEQAKVALAYEKRNSRLIVGAQQRPYWPDGGAKVGTFIKKPWHFATTDTPEEPLGSAVGDFMGQYIAQFFRGRNSDSVGQLKPKYIEIMNEPLFELVEYPGNHHAATVDQVMRFHANVADEIRKHDKEVLIGGYTVAFPNYEVDNFNEWETIDKHFMEVAGKKMDFISIHLYDFPNIPYGSVTREQYRKGSNMEATLDMLDAYMAIEWQTLIPIVVSEYGSQLHGMYNQPWSSERDWLQLKAFNAMIMQFLERPDRIEQSLPFIPLKAEWGRNAPDIPYYWRLMIQQKERPGQTGEKWTFSDLIYFYDLWNGVSGKRLDTRATDPDIQVDAYLNDKTLYVIANSLEFADSALDLSMLGIQAKNIKHVTQRVLYLGDDKIVKYKEKSLGNQFPKNLTLQGEATIVLVIELENAVKQKYYLQESRHYADKMTQTISANKIQSFKVNGLDVAKQGDAILRLGVGRDFTKSLTPTIKINGSLINLPDDFRGYDQNHNAAGEKGKARNSFFGVLEIPFPYRLLKKDNNVDVTFADDGGKISTVIIQNIQHSAVLPRR
ncbi:agarase [Algibacillus agarilyticus]|uniref:agarase n=1 Tax=Algibacillus agarilyticus TaxID=2234133 RepID=UPI000DD0E709|nr:agarase [Algibacillus agarilyticus]